MGWTYRTEPHTTDLQLIEDLVTRTGYFHPPEVAVAVELVEERLQKGSASGYEFVLLDHDEQLVGYTCYGEIACTVGSFDLYWIVVSPDFQGQGIGRRLLNETEQRILQQHGRHIYADTSGRDLYASTRHFYERCGYHVAAQLDDFYAPGDAKVIYRKLLPTLAETSHTDFR